MSVLYANGFVIFFKKRILIFSIWPYDVTSTSHKFLIFLHSIIVHGHAGQLYLFVLLGAEPVFNSFFIMDIISIYTWFLIPYFKTK